MGVPDTKYIFQIEADCQIRLNLGVIKKIDYHWSVKLEIELRLLLDLIAFHEGFAGEANAFGCRRFHKPFATDTSEITADVLLSSFPLI